VRRRWTGQPAVALLGVALLGVALLAVGCGNGDDTGSGSTTTTGSASDTDLSGSLTVMAPGTLKGLLESAKATFESDHPGVKVALNLGHVPTLLTQIEGGVPADVLVTPDATTMGQAAGKGLLDGDAEVIARNKLALVVPAGNPAGVKGVDALGDESKRTAVCAKELPCGKLAEQLAAKSSISLSADTLEPGGSPAIVTKASTGEIDVGLVFATDIRAGGDKVEAIPIPDASNVSSEVSASVLKASTNAAAAQAFIELLASAQGRSLVTAAGFEAP